MDNTAAAPSRPLTVLVIGANGYLGSAISRAFLRASTRPFHFQVYGLVRRESAAHGLAAQEVIPVIGSLSNRSSLCQTILSNSPTWDVIVCCTEPAKTDPVAETQHWNDLLGLVQNLAEASSSSRHAVRPLVLWSSGCKDYGTTGLHGAPGLKPHTETSPLDPPGLLRGRTETALQALDVAQKTGCFDAAVIRATPVFGYSGSYYGAGIEYVAAFAAAVRAEPGQKVLKFPSDANTIVHGIHIDDCADAYVALATTALFQAKDSENRGRGAIAGEVFNISGRWYETLQEIGEALAAEYGFSGGAQFRVSQDELPQTVDSQSTELAFGYSQWVSSEKIRDVTGWSCKRPLFFENVHAYCLAYEAAREGGHDNVAKTRKRMAGDWNDG